MLTMTWSVCYVSLFFKYKILTSTNVENLRQAEQSELKTASSMNGGLTYDARCKLYVLISAKAKESLTDQTDRAEVCFIAVWRSYIRCEMQILCTH